MRKLAVLTGAGISAESGVKTFRDAGGLWEGHRIEDVATPEAWQRQPEAVLEFYNQRRRQLLEVKPNAAHLAIAEAEKDFDVTVITQNVDDLHERAGSSRIVHLHGELLKVRSTGDARLVYDWRKDLLLGEKCEKGFQLRPHIVWFGEMVPMLEVAIPIVADADAILVVGSSMQVYPAASLVGYARRDARILYVDPDPRLNHELALRADLSIIAKPASEGVPEALQVLSAVCP
jgi:NAD-dependent deacetylase